MLLLLGHVKKVSKMTSDASAQSLHEAIEVLACELKNERILQIVKEIDEDENVSAKIKLKSLQDLLADGLMLLSLASPELLKKVDAVVPQQEEDVVDVNRLHDEAHWVNDRLCAWVGDITQLAVDAIVNAANDDGLGCFIPSHRCVDNVIHRFAGPRLRAECVERMRERPGGFGSLVAGSQPIVTRGYRLPASHVVHVTGPHVKGEPTAADAKKLSCCYERCLDEALSLGFRTVAFPCLSTGVFGYPNEAAAEVALDTVQRWLTVHSDADMVVVMDLFADADVLAYERQLWEESNDNGEKDAVDNLELARSWLQTAEAILVCGGAGMSGNPGELVYTNPADFAKAYPWLTPYGYNTSYDCMGLISDEHLPDKLKRTYFTAHAYNQRYRFQPNPAYKALLAHLHDKDYFVYTSNVDGNFVRAGFDNDRVYTPQGDWMFMQCEVPCRRDSFWLAKPILDRIVPLVPNIPEAEFARCPNCGRNALGNVRGGSWFTHAPYDEAASRFQAWVEHQMSVHNGSNATAPPARFVILEIGAGFNTPSVTRLPMEEICREFPQARLVRVNPKHYQIPTDISSRAVGIPMAWRSELVNSLFKPPNSKSIPNPGKRKPLLRLHLANAIYSKSRQFDWRAMLESLRS